MSQIQIRDEAGRGIARIRYRVSEGAGSSDDAIYDNLTDGQGNSGWPIPHWPDTTYTLHINTQDVDERFESAAVTVDHGNDVRIVLPRKPLSRLHLEFPWFVNATGQRVFIKGHTDFLLHKHILDGKKDKVEELLKQRSDFGSNCARIIGMARKFPNGAGIADFRPQAYADYHDRLTDTFELLDKYGMYGYFTAFAATQEVMPDGGEQQQFWGKILEKAETLPNMFLELVNERYAHDNDVANWHLFPMPANVLPICSGSYNDSYQGGGVPVPSRGNFADFHTPRDGHKPEGFKYCADQNATPHPNFRYLKMGVLMGEGQKFGDASLGPIYAGNSILSNPRQARMIAGSARGTALGIVYHTVHGVYSELWDSIETACAAEWFDELR